MPRSRSKSGRRDNVFSIQPKIEDEELNLINEHGVDSFEGEMPFSYQQERPEKEELSNLNGLAASFPLVIQKILLHLPTADLKSLRLSTKPLKQAVNQYIGLDFVLSESQSDYCLSSSSNVQTLDDSMLTSFKTMGIRSLTALKILDTSFSALFPFPYLLQSIHLMGRIDSQFLLGIITSCWNLQEIKFHEPNMFVKLINGNLVNFLHSLGEIIHRKKSIKLHNLKIIQIHCTTTSTMGHLLALLSTIEAKNLSELRCSFGPIHANFYALITGIIGNLMDIAHKTLQDFSFIVEGGSAYPELTAKRRLLRKLNVLMDYPDLLPLFRETYEKMGLQDEERDHWLKNMLETLGKKIRLNSLRLEIDTMEDFANNWLHFTKYQKNLHYLLIQTCCSWALVKEVVMGNASQLLSLALIMEFTTVMDMEEVLGNCKSLSFLHLKNYDYDTEDERALELRRSGHIINAKFDKIFPNLEGLVLCDVLIPCGDMARLNNLNGLKCLMYSLIDVNPVIRAGNQEGLFGITFEDFQKMLFRRNLDYLVLTKETIVLYGEAEKIGEDEEKLGNLLREEMFHTSNVLGGPPMELDEYHVAVAHGEPISGSHWFFSFLLSAFGEPSIYDSLSVISFVEGFHE
ncbi:unnamed protein product [Orchesella dallaii]|uniref:F-box domain-containing protein n=1 Tax=Orchesella dallaii TaxID=48710 RepID=A0ABP1R0X4_9HEXA